MHPLVSLGAITILDRHVVFREMYHYRPADEWWTYPTGPWPEHYEAIRSLAERCRSWDGSLWTEQISPWADVVDAGRSLFGERDAFDRLALISSAVRDANQRGGGHTDLNDQATSLVVRARFARYRHSDMTWWRKQLDGAPDPRSKHLAMSLILAWASSETIAEFESEITKHVEQLSPEHYARLSVDLAHVSRFRTRWPKLRIQSASARMFGLVEPRLSERDSRDLYLRCDFHVNQRDTSVLALLLSREIEAIGPGKEAGGWDRALAMFRRAVQIEVADLGEFSFARHPRMPPDVAREIIRSAERYPLSIIGAAESRLAPIAARKAPLVGRIAKRDGWFASGP